MTTVYLVRHAEAEGNLYRRVHGWYNSLITDNGYRQIAALRGRFADIHIDAVYSSDLFRTMTTAKAVYLSHGLELHTDPGLREIGLGAWEDKPWGELERCDAMNLIRFNHSSPDFRVEGGETFAQVQARLKVAVLRLAAAHPARRSPCSPTAPPSAASRGPSGGWGPARWTAWATATTPPSPAWRWRAIRPASSLRTITPTCPMRSPPWPASGGGRSGTEQAATQTCGSAPST